MKRLKYKLNAIWRILKSDGFDMAVTYPSNRGFVFESMSVFGKDNTANIVHHYIGNYFNIAMECIEKTNKEMSSHVQ